MLSSMARMFLTISLWLAAIATPCSLSAQELSLPNAGSDDVPEAASPAAEQAIAQRQSDISDRDITRRISGIFDQIEDLAAVDVEVRAGVVSLSGEVPSEQAFEQAESIASRVSGVVTVQNGLERNVDVESNVTPALEGLRDDGMRLVRALPLIGVAMLIALLIGLFGHFLASASSFWQRVAPNIFLAELLAGTVRFVFIVLGIVVALQIVGATALLGAVLGGAGVIGIALGFAVRDTVDNYVSSLMLSLRQPFRANDHVVIEGQEGRVVRLTSRATILMTLDGNHLRIPNSMVFKAVILNYTRNPERRFEFDLGVDADDDPLAAIRTGTDVMRALPFILDDPEIRAFIVDVGDSSIILRFEGWVDQGQSDFCKARSLCVAQVKNALEAAGFALPEPIYRLRFDDGVPLRQSGDSPGGPAKSGRPAAARPAPPVSDSEALHDVRPDDAIVEKVDDERQMDATGTRDLLDDRRPIE